MNFSADHARVKVSNDKMTLNDRIDRIDRNDRNDRNDKNDKNDRI